MSSNDQQSHTFTVAIYLKALPSNNGITYYSMYILEPAITKVETKVQKIALYNQVGLAKHFHYRNKSKPNLIRGFKVGIVKPCFRLALQLVIINMYEFYKT